MVRKNTQGLSKASSAQSSAPDFSAAGGLFFSAHTGDESAQIPAVTPVHEAAAAATMVLFQEPDVSRAVQARRERRQKSESFSDAEDTAADDLAGDAAGDLPKRSRRGTRGGRKSAETRDASDTNMYEADDTAQSDIADDESSPKRTRRRRSVKVESTAISSPETPEEYAESDVSELKQKQKKAKQISDSAPSDEAVAGAVSVRKRRRRSASSDDISADQVTAPKGSTRLEAKRQRRKEGREAGRRRHTISESEFLARRESVARSMLVREKDGLNQIAVIEDGILVEHYVARHTQSSMVGNVYLGRVQNVLPSMEAAFVDIGKGRNAVLYAGEVNWDVAGLEGKPRRIEEALKSGDTVLVQVTKDPIGHKGARLTSQITLAGRHLVLVPSGAMTGISRKLPEKERTRLKRILKDLVPSEHGVIVRTAAEGATEEQLRLDVERLTKSWKDIQAKSKSSKNAPSLLKGEPELAVRVVRDVFNEDFDSLSVQGENTWETISEYVQELSPELVARVHKWEDSADIFAAHRVDEQLAKAFDRAVYLPSGGSLVIDRTEAMTVIDVNTGKFTGTGGSLEETVTKNNLEAAEEIVRQLRLRDIGGIVVIDFIDMVLEANRELVLRRLIECLGRDRTRHQVAEVTSLGLVQMTRKRVGQGLVEAFSTVCEHCEGRGYVTYDHPIEKGETPDIDTMVVGGAALGRTEKAEKDVDPEAEAKQAEVKAALNNIAAAAAHKHKEKENRSSSKSLQEKENKQAQAPSASLKGTKKPRGIVTSSGTITPVSSISAASAIMSFPVKKNE